MIDSDDKLHTIENLLSVIKTRLDSIENTRLKILERKIDKINGRVGDHDQWIASRKPVCGWHEDTVRKIEEEQTEMHNELRGSIEELRKTVTDHTSKFANRSGSWSGVQATLNTIVSALTLLAVMWVAFQS